jgi:hypothetical protein
MELCLVLFSCPLLLLFFFKKKIIVHCEDTICDLIDLTMNFNISYTKINKRCVK